ncbi:MAG TPA: Fic family protein [Cryptosporangiaceae bacterium]|nr:Fic family protein [Cryptosporangiaceae bacterium]
MASDQLRVDVPAWPRIGWEQHPWHSKIDPDHVSRRARERHQGPYRAAVPPTVADRHVVLAAGAMARAVEASVEMSRFDAEMGADIAPFEAVLLRSESAASSRIEGLTASARSIALAELGDDDRRNAREIVANSSAMRAAIDLADRLDADALLAMHAALMGTTHADVAGRWRAEQVWIGGSDYGPHHATFVPPHHDRVPAAIDDLVRFLARDDIPALAHAALAHAQFETIHPFVDGNGRTGRALVHALLLAKGVTRNVTVPVSAGLLTDTDAYFHALDRYRDGDPARIVELMAEASFAAIDNGRQLVAELRDARRRWTEVVSARRDAAAWKLADLLLRQPVIDSELARAALGATSANTHRAIRQLVDAGVLVEFSGKRRNRRWQAPEVLRALDDFAERAGRRRLAGSG